MILLLYWYLLQPRERIYNQVLADGPRAVHIVQDKCAEADFGRDLNQCLFCWHNCKYIFQVLTRVGMSIIYLLLKVLCFYYWLVGS